MRYVIWAAALAAGGYLLHRITLWAENRGWIYYRTTGSVDVGEALIQAQALLDPGKKHLLQRENRREARRGGDGDRDGPDFPVSSIDLLGLDRSEWQQIAADPGGFARERGVRLAVDLDLLRQLGSGTVAFLGRVGGHGVWTSYLAVSALDRVAVGTCSFKSPPDPDGVVEIAYYTFPPFEGRGVGTAMAARLVEVARSAGVRRVRAHTLPTPGPSTRFLEKNGFRRAGQVIDPEDGLVWRWERE